MSFHIKYDRWKSWSEPENCPVCKQLPMPEGMVDIIELPSSWLSAEPHECLKGACHLTAKRHVVELFELADDEMLELMRDLKLCARALKHVTNAVKINYEIHGNTLPHLHIHLYPRYMVDPFPNQAINPYQKRSDWYGEGEFDQFVERMRQELAVLRGDA